MQIGAVNQEGDSNKTQNGGSHINRQDPRIKAIQNQIENVRKRLSELSANENMSVEQKKERRRQLNEEMNELNKRLSQVQMEIQQENMKKAENNKSEKNENSNNNQNSGGIIKNAGFSENIISSDLAVKQMEYLESIKGGMEGYKKILKSQIKQDMNRHVNAESKEKELSDVESGIRRTEKSLNEKREEINEKAKETEKEDDENEGEKKYKNLYQQIDIKL